MDIGKRGVPVAPSLSDQAKLLHKALGDDVGLGDNVEESFVCCICDLIITDPSKIVRKHAQNLPLIAWRVLLHHVHSDESWRSPPRDLGALHALIFMC